MCFQGYAHFTCGCTKMFEEECEHAKELETAPFYLKLACPNYAIARSHPPYDCGKGGEFCSATPDAPYLEHITDCKTMLQTQIATMDKFINEVVHPRRKQALDELNQQYAGNLAMVKQAYMSRPGCTELDQKWAFVLQEKRKRAARLAQNQGILRYSRDFYLLQRQAHGNVVGNMQKLPDVLKNLQAATTNQAPVQPPPVWNIPQVPQQLQQPQQGTSMQDAMIPSQGERLYSLPQADPFASTEARVKKMMKEMQSEKAATKATHEPAQKRGRTMKKPVKEKKPADDNDHDDDSPNLRRSTRVRGKKVNYNETSDEYPSRTPSPQKSDASDWYSPPKSEVSDHNAKTTRGSSSLLDMIGEYKRQSGGTTTPARRQSSMSSAATLSAQKSGLINSVPQIQIDSPRSNTPDTDILATDDPRHDGGLQAPIQARNTATSVQRAPRVLAGGNPDPALLAFQKAYEQTRLLQRSGINIPHGGTFSQQGISNSSNASFQPQQGFNSLGTTFSLPKPAQYQTMSDPTEPRKRSMPASSPILPSNKRLELSFPGGYSTPPSNFTETKSASSPPKPTYMQRQDSGKAFGSSPPRSYNNNTSMPPPPPPPPMFKTFAPSGLSQVSPMQDVFPPEASLPAPSGAQAASTEIPQDTDDANVTFVNNEISDLDWSLFSDGSKF